MAIEPMISQSWWYTSKGLMEIRALGASVAHSPPAREAALLLVAEVVGRHRMGRWLAFAVRALAIAKMTNIALSLLRGPPAGTADRQPP